MLMEDSQVMTDSTDQSGTIPTSPPSMQENDAQFSPKGKEIPKAAAPLSQNGDPETQLLLKEMRGLRLDFDAKVKYDASKERLIETLHRELQTYQEGLHFRVLRPVFTDLITLYDDIGKLLESMLLVAGSNTTFPLVQNMTIFQETVEEILRRNGAEAFAIEGQTFQSNRQRILRVIPTLDPALDKQIARRVKKGFIYEEIVLRSEVVEIYKYTPTTS